MSLTIDSVEMDEVDGAVRALLIKSDEKIRRLVSEKPEMRRGALNARPLGRGA